MSDDRAAKGVPVTPEMVEAAQKAFYAYTYRNDYRSIDELREDVFAEMLSAALRGLRAS